MFVEFCFNLKRHAAQLEKKLHHFKESVGKNIGIVVKPEEFKSVHFKTHMIEP